MNFPSRETVEKLRREYPPGTRVELLEMDDPFPIPVGTLGKVQRVNDAGDLEVLWNNGRTLHMVYNVDRVRKVGKNEHTF